MSISLSKFLIHTAAVSISLIDTAAVSISLSKFLIDTAAVSIATVILKDENYDPVYTCFSKLLQNFESPIFF